MPEIKITIRDKIATPTGSPAIVCGNSDYTVTFDMDSEWSPYTARTARFNYTNADGVRRHQDVLFTGNSCAVPVMNDTHAVEIGVYAGDIHTSTPARIPCARSATDDAAEHPDPTPDVYDQLLDYLANGGGAGGGGGAMTSDVKAVSPGGVLEVIIAIAEEET